jgi:hypothetical protein
MNERVKDVHVRYDVGSVELSRSSTDSRAFRRTVSMINSSKGGISEIESGNLPLTTPHSIHDVLPEAYRFDRILLKVVLVR